MKWPYLSFVLELRFQAIGQVQVRRDTALYDIPAATGSNITAEEVFCFYARRWSIKGLFNQMKNRWGWRETWQQTRQVLHRWTQILSIASALPQLLATYCGEQVQPLMLLTPWHKEKQIVSDLDCKIFYAMFGFRTGGTRNAENTGPITRLIYTVAGYFPLETNNVR
jgi:hypothetical protein